MYDLFMKNRFLNRAMLAALAAMMLGGCAGGTGGGGSESTAAETAAEAAEDTSENAGSAESVSENAEVVNTEAADADGGAPDGPMPDVIPAGPDGGPGMPGGGPADAARPENYDAVVRYDSDTEVSGISYSSTGKDQNALLVEKGTVSISDAEISRTSDDSTGGDRACFNGMGAAALSTGGTLKLSGSTVTTDAAGGTGIFVYGSGVAYVSDSSIHTAQDTSGGIHAAGGGTIYADNVTAETEGQSSAAIRSDRGGGTMVVTGGSYTSHGKGSPAVYSTAGIMVSNAKLAATGSEAVCIEGRNSLKLTDCDLSGSMEDDKEQNDNTWTVIVYQSMSGDAEEGCGSFTMRGGTLTSTNGGLFYTTNTESEITLENVRISAAGDCEFLLQCTGNTNARGWGQTGENGAKCTFTAANQTAEGDVIWDSISTLDMYLKESSALCGMFRRDDTWSGYVEPETEAAAEQEAAETAAETEAAGETENAETAAEASSEESGDADATDGQAAEEHAESAPETEADAAAETETSGTEPENAYSGYAALYIDASSVWVVTGNSTLTTLENKGLVTDPDGRIVNITGTDGTVYVEGDSSYTVTVGEYRR